MDISYKELVEYKEKIAHFPNSDACFYLLKALRSSLLSIQLKIWEVGIIAAIYLIAQANRNYLQNDHIYLIKVIPQIQHKLWKGFEVEKIKFDFRKNYSFIGNAHRLENESDRDFCNETICVLADKDNNYGIELISNMLMHKEVKIPMLVQNKFLNTITPIIVKEVFSKIHKAAKNMGYKKREYFAVLITTGDHESTFENSKTKYKYNIPEGSIYIGNEAITSILGKFGNTPLYISADKRKEIYERIKKNR